MTFEAAVRLTEILLAVVVIQQSLEHLATPAHNRWLFLSRIACCLFLLSGWQSTWATGGLAALSLVFSDLLFWIWVLPLLLGMPFLRLYLLAEHGRCAFVANLFENARTTYTNRIVRFLAWNMPYHVEHHAIPNVPFHNLPALHQEMLGHHKVISDGYAAFTKEYVQDLRG